jgi:hypothetical protein
MRPTTQRYTTMSTVCWLLVLLVTLLLAGVVAYVGLVGGASSAVASCAVRWRVVASPNPDPRRSGLSAVDAVSARDVWAVGWTGDEETRAARTLAEHWNGHAWRRVATANVTGRANILADVAASAPDDVWAVGSSGVGIRELPLIEHWDGRHWRVVEHPAARGGQAELTSVSAAASGDVWVVGSGRTSDGWLPLIEHWDGQSWQTVPSADLGDDDGYLIGVAALSPTQAWAVGRVGNSPLIERWDGARWSKVAGLDNNADTALVDIAATSGGQAWAVGYFAAAPLVWHLDGGSWEELKVPFAHYRRWYNRRINSYFNGVAASGQNDVWITGTRLEHWNGRQLQTGPTNGGGNGLAAVSKTDFWEVGTVSGRHFVYRTRILHYACR